MLEYTINLYDAENTPVQIPETKYAVVNGEHPSDMNGYYVESVRERIFQEDLLRSLQEQVDVYRDTTNSRIFQEREKLNLPFALLGSEINSLTLVPYVLADGRIVNVKAADDPMLVSPIIDCFISAVDPDKVSRQFVTIPREAVALHTEIVLPTLTTQYSRFLGDMVNGGSKDTNTRRIRQWTEANMQQLVSSFDFDYTGQVAEVGSKLLREMITAFKNQWSDQRDSLQLNNPYIELNKSFITNFYTFCCLYHYQEWSKI